MTPTLGIHEELGRLVLRARWIRWSLRNYSPGVYRLRDGKHIALSRRLTEFKPTWDERQQEELSEMDK